MLDLPDLKIKSLILLKSGFPLYFGIKIQGLFKDFQGPLSCIFKNQFSTEVYSTDSIKATCNTVESRYIELGYFEVSLISNRCQRPGD